LAHRLSQKPQGDIDVQRLPSTALCLHTIVAALVSLLLLPHTALAQSRVNEPAARALAKKAMEDDYLNTDFDKALDKLNQAVAKCGTDKCGVQLRAQLKRDISAVQSAGGHKDAALAAMIDAFHIDAGLELDPNYKTKELEAIYKEAKKQAAGSSGPSGPPPAGDFTHTPVTEQQVRTPIPIYVEYAGSETLKRVIAKYKGLGMTEWKSLQLNSIGNGYGANTPCADVQTGDFVYYIQGFNEQNDPVASGGDRSNPYKVVVKNDAVADPPHLPGASPPTQCAEKGDCPPDFPGCKKGAAPVVDDSLKNEGESCEEDSECKSSQCKDQKCTAPPDSGPKRKKFWLGVAGDFDFSFLSSSQNVCQLYVPAGDLLPNNPSVPTNGPAATPTNSKHYYCTNNGNDFPTKSTPTQAAAIIPNEGDSVGGGIVPAHIRLLASFDYALTTNTMLGARVGYVLKTYPGTQATHFPPVHIEARYSYVFGDDPIGKSGFHPFILAGLGVSEFDASVNVAVYEVPFTTSANLNGTGCTTTGAKCSVSTTAWQTSGPFFLEAGPGVRWEVVSGFAFLADLKLVGAIGGNGFTFIPTPEVGAQVGF
jgi:hypothetical protein